MIDLQEHRKPTDTEANVKLGVNKMHSLKPGKYTHKSSDGQSFTGSKIALKGDSSVEVPYTSLTNVFSFFPIDEAIQKVLQQEKHNPFEFPSKFASQPIESNTEQTVVDNESKVTPFSWIDCISNIIFWITQQIPTTCDSLDVAIASLIAPRMSSCGPGNSSAITSTILSSIERGTKAPSDTTRLGQ
ncbi:hypothetical protein VPH35_137550 [Triticum aestivum]